MNAFASLILRDLKLFYRQKSRLIGTLVTPLLFFLLLSKGISATGAQGFFGSENYTQFLVPGILILSAVFTAIFSSIGLIQDKSNGVLQSLWVSPLSRLTLILSKSFSAAIIATIQSAFILVLLPFLGMSIAFVVFSKIMAILFLTVLVLSSLSFLFAWKIDSVEGFHSVMNLVIMPMWFLSGGIFPIQNSSGVLLKIAQLNPLFYGTRSIQSLLFQGFSESFLVDLVFLLMAFLLLSFVSYRLLKKQSLYV